MNTDLVGGPFAVIESDPGVFTSLIRHLGIRGLEVVELYGIEQHDVNHLNPKGLIFCFIWHKDTHRPGDFDDPAADKIWFANQLIDDACASQAILNVVLNCPDINIGEDLRIWRSETEEMSPVMRGLAISNSSYIRQAHNSLARPADLRGSLNLITTTTFEAKKIKKKRETVPPPSKRHKSTGTPRRQSKVEEDDAPGEEVYHFIGYVPAHSKVWELDGLKSGPLEVGELPGPSNAAWMDVVRPALKNKMKKYGDIRYSLLALVEDRYMSTSDELEFLKRDRAKLETRMNHCLENWHDKVDPELANTSKEVFATSVRSQNPSPAFSSDFASRRLEQDKRIIDTAPPELPQLWEACVRSAIPAKVAVEEEISKSTQAYSDHIKRTHDYEPFIMEFMSRLHKEGALNPLLGRDEDDLPERKGKSKNKSRR